ncbi:putative baseplate assembly protein [Actinokineospora globicatena]|uniref:Baseplate assembly protein n=1 Tax=Actinokineospora globicatena TaxID=103729 RepID=A0A9W6QJT7_9PSEU|nr:putative baseplate assembly protein [Actinokineospora globicatena]GLW89980.1 putative baseplate assembly protein [Actinokineospora globicatena]
MALPAPNLDDRRFQQLVDEAKRYVRNRCPEWTDHNVSDPGVTLIETFAQMVDQLVYRLNRVPERNYLAFLDLLGVRLFPPTAAKADVTFWLSAPQAEVVLLPAGTEVATARAETAEAVVFATIEPLPIVPTELTALVTKSAAGEHTDRTKDLVADQDVRCFQTTPAPGDATLFGLSVAAPRCVVVLRLDSQVEGIGVDPRQPPLVWEAWDGHGWTVCETDEDSTGGLNRPGEVVVHLPASHTESAISGTRAGWVRCRVTEPDAGQPFYAESPTIRVAEAFTLGGTTTVEHAETVPDVPLGQSQGVPGQKFTLPRTPVLTDGEPVTVLVSDGEGWQQWIAVEHFGESGPHDRHIVLDATLGEVRFPPAVREPNGEPRHYGAVPPKGATILVERYRTGGGRVGNVARGSISVLRSSVPYVSAVVNREAARGGVDGETVAEARERAPQQLRVQDRAVTASDHERIAHEAAPSLARVRCLPSSDEPGAARILVVPSATTGVGDYLRIEQLIPSDEVLAAVAERLDARRLLGTRAIVTPPRYQGITVVARLRAADAEVDHVRTSAQDALHGYLNPLTGGAGGTGWEFGRAVQYGEIFAVLQRVAGVGVVEEILLFPANPLTGVRGGRVDRVDLTPDALVFSYQHQVTVVGAS